MSGNERLKLKLDQALHWIWSWQLQMERLIASTEREPGNFKGVKRQKAFSRTSFDEHMLAVTGWNMFRALEPVQRQIPLIRALHSTDAQAVLELLRHCYERWDQLQPVFSRGEYRGAVKELSEKSPDARPWSITYRWPDGDWVLGNVVSIRQLSAKLEKIESEILDAREKYTEPSAVGHSSGEIS